MTKRGMGFLGVPVLALTVLTTANLLSVVFAEDAKFNPYAPYPDKDRYMAAGLSFAELEHRMFEHSRRLGHLAEDLQSVYAASFDSKVSGLIGDRLSSARELLSIQTGMRDPDDFKYVALTRAATFGVLGKECYKRMGEIDRDLPKELINSESIFDEAKSMRETLSKLCAAFTKASERT